VDRHVCRTDEEVSDRDHPEERESGEIAVRRDSTDGEPTTPENRNELVGDQNQDGDFGERKVVADSNEHVERLERDTKCYGVECQTPTHEGREEKRREDDADRSGSRHMWSLATTIFLHYGTLIGVPDIEKNY
jgi:hypothetical protein